MKIMKKISAVLLALCLCAASLSMNVYAANGRISFSDPETKVGDMVEVKCVVKSTSGNLGNVEVKLSYDAAYLRFDGGDGVTADGDGALTCTSSGGSAEVTFNISFQALQEGSTKISVSNTSISSSSGSSLTLDQGNSTVKIGAGDPSKIQQASTSSADDLEVEVNGVSYKLTDNFADADIPSGYTRTQVPLDGSDRQMVVNESGTIYLGYLLDADNLGDFFIYNQDDATFAPYEEVTISDTTSIVILSDTSKVDLPDTYQEAKLTLNDKEFPVWQDTEHDGYYVLYAMNNNGETGYYQYDTVENTYQRFEPSASESSEKKSDGSLMGKIRDFIDNHLQLLVLIVGLGGILILIILIVLAVKLRNRNLELDDLYDEYGIDLDEEEPVKPQKTSKKEKASAKNGLRGKKKYDEDDFDDYEDDFDDYEDDFEVDDLDEDDFDDYEDDYEEDDFDVYGSSDDDDDIFSDKNLGRYDTRNYQDSLPISGMDEDDDLSDLLNDLSEGRRGHAEKDDAFEVDFIDLD